MDRTIFGFDFDRVWDYENGFYLTSDPTRIGKLLAHYELYKRIVSLPGHVVECGVFKGASLLRFATFRRLLEHDDSRQIVGFDVFGSFPRDNDAADSAFVEQFERRAGIGISPEELTAILRHKTFTNVKLVRGDVRQTIPQFAAERPEFKVSLLHLDFDVYEPTRTALEYFFPRVVPGGVIVLDDYGTVPGATRAIDEFLAGRNLSIQKLSLAHIPAFVVLP
jgi:hypothetical protein